MATAIGAGRGPRVLTTIEQVFYRCGTPPAATAAPPSLLDGVTGRAMPAPPYAELHAHTSFSFLDGASAPADLVARAVELGLSGLAATDRQGLYGVVRFATAAEEAGLHRSSGWRWSSPIRWSRTRTGWSSRAAGPPAGVARRRPVAGSGGRSRACPPAAPERARLPGHRAATKEDHRGIGMPQRGPHLVLLARNAAGYRSLCRLLSRANLAGTKAAPRLTRRCSRTTWRGWWRSRAAGERAGAAAPGGGPGRARAVAREYARRFGGPGEDMRGPAS